VQHAITTRSTLPILRKVLLTTVGKSRLRLSATNLEIGITCTVAARVKAAGSTAISFHHLLAIVKLIPAEEQITLRLVEPPVNSQHGSACLLVGDVAVLPCEEASRFPCLHPTEQPSSVVRFPVRQFKEAVARVAFAAAPDTYEAMLANVWLQVDRRRGTSLAASDGVCCASSLLPVRARKTRGARGDLFLAPAQTLMHLVRLLPDEGEVQLSASAHGYLCLRSSVGEFVVRLNCNEEVGLGGLHNDVTQYTNHWRVRPFAQYIPEHFPTLLIMARNVLRAALKNAPGTALFSLREEEDRVTLVIMLYGEKGEVATRELPVILWGPSFAPLWVNPRRLATALTRPGASASLALGFGESRTSTIVLRWLGMEGVQTAYSYAFAPLDPYSLLKHPFLRETLSSGARDVLSRLVEQSRASEDPIITRLRKEALHLILAILEYRMEPTVQESQQSLQRLKQLSSYPSSYFLDLCRDHFDKVIQALALGAFVPGGCLLQYGQPEVQIAFDARQIGHALEHVEEEEVHVEP
jgi:hypothetical protein